MSIPVVNPESAPVRVLRARVAGHFGELVQGRLGDGPLALITLPCPVLLTEVSYARSGAGDTLSITPDPAEKIRALWELLAACWSLPEESAALHVARARLPGSGAGSSTADLLGVMRVLAAAHDHALGPDEEAQLCLAIDGAVDPLMLEDSVLYASRQAEVIRSLPALPAMRIVGGFAGPGRPTDPADLAFPDMTTAFAQAEKAMVEGDLTALARASHVSAEANQDRNPNPFWDALLHIGTEHGALGPVVSHTGSAIGLIFPPGTIARPVREALYEAGLRDLITF